MDERQVVIVMVPIGPLLVFLEGTSLTATEREMLHHPAVGGIIFFSRNYNNKEKLSKLVSEIREVAPRMILAVDHEGGRVQRFKHGFTRLPPAHRFGELFDRDPGQALRLAYAAARLAAIELTEIGFHTGFSPVLDLFGPNRAIGDRAFHANPEVVACLGAKFIEGLCAGGLMPVGKHFPGHGATAGDTHDEVVEDWREYAQIKATDLKVFRDAITKAALPSVMAGHTVYPRVDAQPASLSRRWLNEILRGELGFDGLVFSDDLAMRGIRAGGGRASAKRLLEAGCDMVLVCRGRQLLQEVLAELSTEEIKLYAERLGQRWHDKFQSVMALYKKNYHIPWDPDTAREELSRYTGEQSDG